MSSVIHPLQDTVCRALEQMEWKYEISEDGWVTARVRGRQAAYDVRLRTDEEAEIVACFVATGTLVPEERRAAAAEALTRANWGLRVGNFEMDYSDGEVRYKTSVDVEGGLLGHTMVQNMVAAGISMQDRYHPALMQVVYAGVDPAAAVAEAER